MAGRGRDHAQPDAPVCLDILVDGAVVAFAVAEEHRVDLAEAGVGHGRHGFDLRLSVALTPGVGHVVEVRRSADRLRVWLSHRGGLLRERAGCLDVATGLLACVACLMGVTALYNPA